MKKLSSFLCILLVLTMIFTGCTSNSQPDKQPSNEQENTTPPVNEEPVEKTDVNIVGLKGPTSIGMIKLFEDKALNSDKYNVTYEAYDAPDTVTSKLVKGEIQIAALPTNAAAVLYNKTQGKIQFLAENTLGILYLIGTEEITDISQLAGKTVAMSGKGTVVEYAFNYILEKNNLLDKVETVYYPDHATVSQVMLAGDVSLAVAPQPFVTQVTSKNPDIKVSLDITKEWEKASNGESILSMGCLVINKEFADNNKEFVKDFMTEYEKSVQFVTENPKDAAVLVEKNGILPNAAIIEKAIPYCNIVFKSAADAKGEINEFLKVLFDANNASVGGKLPDEGFYYEQ